MAIRRETHHTIWNSDLTVSEMPYGYWEDEPQRWSFISLLFITSKTSLFSPAVLLCSFHVHLMHLIVQIFSLSFSVQIQKELYCPIESSLLLMQSFVYYWGYLTKFRLPAFISGVSYAFDPRAEKGSCSRELMATLIQGTAKGHFPQHFSREWEGQSQLSFKEKLTHSRYIL